MINTAIIMAAANRIVATRDPTKLLEHGDHIQITKSWAKSLMIRMGYVKWKASNAGKYPFSVFVSFRMFFLLPFE